MCAAAGDCRSMMLRRVYRDYDDDDENDEVCIHILYIYIYMYMIIIIIIITYMYVLYDIRPTCCPASGFIIIFYTYICIYGYE